jgi:hypothetical protein
VKVSRLSRKKREENGRTMTVKTARGTEAVSAPICVLETAPLFVVVLLAVTAFCAAEKKTHLSGTGRCDSRGKAAKQCPLPGTTRQLASRRSPGAAMILHPDACSGIKRHLKSREAVARASIHNPGRDTTTRFRPAKRACFAGTKPAEQPDGPRLRHMRVTVNAARLTHNCSARLVATSQKRQKFVSRPAKSD